MNTKIFEIIMLLCFGAAWPFSIHKSLVAEKMEAKSLAFLYIIILGYIAGIIHKLINDRDYVIIFYAANLCMVSIDIAVYHLRSRSAE